MSVLTYDPERILITFVAMAAALNRDENHCMHCYYVSSISRASLAVDDETIENVAGWLFADHMIEE
jgi:hypothetical protein